MIDRAGTYLDYHAGDAGELLVAPDQFLGKNVRDVLPPDIAQKSLHSIERALDSHEPVSLEYSLPVHDELRFYEARCMATVFTRLVHGRAKEILGTLTDVTALKRAEEELHSLSARLLEVEKTEQRRTARELHDGTAQMLFAIGANLANMRKLIGLPSNVIGALGDCQALVDECLKEVRSLSYLLHHPLLEQAGLPAALEWVAEGFSQWCGIDVELEIDASLERLPLPLERHLFRVVLARAGGSPSGCLNGERY